MTPLYGVSASDEQKERPKVTEATSTCRYKACSTKAVKMGGGSVTFHQRSALNHLHRPMIPSHVPHQAEAPRQVLHPPSPTQTCLRTSLYPRAPTRLRQYPLLRQCHPTRGGDAVRAAPATPPRHQGGDVPGGFLSPMLLLTRFARLRLCRVGSQQAAFVSTLPKLAGGVLGGFLSPMLLLTRFARLRLCRVGFQQAAFVPTLPMQKTTTIALSLPPAMPTCTLATTMRS